MRYGFITWKPHINETFLNEEFFIIFKPLLYRAERFLLCIEKEGTPEAHYHAVLSFPDASNAESNLHKKFNSVAFKKFYASIKERQLQTIIDSKFSKQALKVVVVKKDPSEHDYLYVLGYCGKTGDTHIIDSKGYTEDFISTATKYYWNDSRKDSQGEPSKKTFMVLNGKNVHTYTHHFCEKHGISLKDNMLMVRLAELGIACDNIGPKQMVRAIAFLNINKNKEDPNHLTEFEKSIYENDLSLDITFDYKNPEEKPHTEHLMYMCLAGYQEKNYIERIRALEEENAQLKSFLKGNEK